MLGFEQVEPDLDDILQTENGLNAFRRLVKDWPSDDMQLDFKIAPGRAGAVGNADGGSMIMYRGGDEFLGTIVHEVGHALENADHKSFPRRCRFFV